jgi:hypothetical protein
MNALAVIETLTLIAIPTQQLKVFWELIFYYPLVKLVSTF